MSLSRRLTVIERSLMRRMPRHLIATVAETPDLDQYRAVMEASAMRADGRLAPGTYLEGMCDWQRVMLDDYGEAMATLMSIGRNDNVDPAKAGSAGATCQASGVADQPGPSQPGGIGRYRRSSRE
jgi:hypothetical protein